MALIDDATAAQLRSAFARLSSPVRLVVFSQALAEPASEEVRRLVEEVAAIDTRLSAEPRNIVLDKDRAEELGIERIPAIAVLGPDEDFGVRFYGLPSGYEFGSLIDLVLDVSSGDSGLAAGTREALASLERDVHIRVFSTPT
jgi:alkyl hydroperoxide reductase subunit AhpF